MKSKGILLEKGDLNIKPVRDASGLITRGIVIGDVTRQNQACILSYHPGEVKESPVVGVGVSKMLLSHDSLLYKHRIREQLELDGQRVDYLNINISTTGKAEIQLNATYGNNR